jgi:hypothetical protein
MMIDLASAAKEEIAQISLPILEDLLWIRQLPLY